MPDDLLRAASESKAEEAVRPLSEALFRLDRAAMALKEAALASAREDARAAMLAAIGLPYAKVADASGAEESMLAALDAVRALLRPPDEPLVEPVAPSPASELPLPPTAGDLVRAEEAIGYVQNVAASYKEEHPRRLGLLLQIAAADLRIAIAPLPAGHEMHGRLVEAFQQIGQVKSEVPEIGFIHGLSKHHRRDWHAMAIGLRQKLSRFDQDSGELAPASQPQSVRTPKARRPDRASLFDWPELPHLRAAMERAPAVVVGGSDKDVEKLSLIQQRLGLVMEWEPVEPDNVRAAQSLAERVRSGKVCALVVVNGFMSHKVWDIVHGACSSASVPYAMAGKGGIGGIEQAARELDEKVRPHAASP